jgi:hypothetical protein
MLHDTCSLCIIPTYVHPINFSSFPVSRLCNRLKKLAGYKAGSRLGVRLQCTCVFVGHRLATKVFIGKLPATRGVQIIIVQANDERGHGPTN